MLRIKRLGTFIKENMLKEKEQKRNYKVKYYRKTLRISVKPA
jgi:hypothetical protein